MEISPERGKVTLSCALSSDVSEQMKPLVVVVSPTSWTWSHEEAASPEFGARSVLLADKAGYLFATADHGVSHGLSASVVRKNVMQDCGPGLFARADLILGGLDNREVRLWINRAAWTTNRPWIDGVNKGINGVARVFLAGQPKCCDCTLGDPFEAHVVQPTAA